MVRDSHFIAKYIPHKCLVIRLGLGLGLGVSVRVRVRVRVRG